MIGTDEFPADDTRKQALWGWCRYVCRKLCRHERGNPLVPGEPSPAGRSPGIALSSGSVVTAGQKTVLAC
ncbi:MAG TPA: hypothetical protein VK036_07065, partial [Wenzhouxiangella sp.]|nr:hypothetical protein [Wenzhouxiangella sp.]